MSFLRTALAAILIASGLFASVATGATRYASPTGTGPAATCPQANPCSLQEAVENAAVQDGDQIVVTTGAVPYSESNELTVGNAITVHGQTGMPRPTINSSALSGILLTDPGALLHDLAVNHSGVGAGLVVTGGMAERLQVSSSGAIACQTGSSTESALIRDSSCLSGAGPALYVGDTPGPPTTAKLRNVTAYAVGASSIGMDVDAGFSGVLVDARNVIVSGGLEDVHADASGGPMAIVALASSNYETAVEGSVDATITEPGSESNQTAAPQLVNPVGGNFAQLPTSPTIDAGTNAPDLGTLDLDSDARIQGPLPDIGADEAPDVTAPQTTIESGPPSVTKEARPEFTFSSSEAGSTFACSIETATFVPCTSPYKPGSLSQGDYVLRVRATDPAGNVDPTPAERSFSVDRNVNGANASAKRVQRQRGRKVSLTVSVKATEDVRVSSAGRLRLSKKKAFDFKSNAVNLDAGEKRKLELRPKKASASRKILKKLKQGGRVKGTLTATFTDGVGNKATTGAIEIKVK